MTTRSETPSDGVAGLGNVNSTLPSGCSCTWNGGWSSRLSRWAGATVRLLSGSGGGMGVCAGFIVLYMLFYMLRVNGSSIAISEVIWRIARVDQMDYYNGIVLRLRILVPGSAQLTCGRKVENRKQSIIYSSSRNFYFATFCLEGHGSNSYQAGDAGPGARGAPKNPACWP